MRILYVEDHADTAAVFSRLLCRDGFSVTVAATLAEARHLLNEQPFEVLVADIRLPDGDGWELGPLAARRGAVAVALTGYDGIGDVARSDTSGFVAHLVKPVTVPQVKAAIAAAMDPSTSRTSAA